MHIRSGSKTFRFVSGNVRRNILGYLLVGTTLSACTTSMSVREDIATSSEAVHGIAYRLPEKDLTIEVTWAVSDCPMTSGPSAAMSAIGFETSAAVTSKVIEGPSLVIDYTRMTNRFKSGSFTAEYYVNEDKSPSRILKNINASIKGEEPAALKSAISSGVKIAKLALGLPGAPAGASAGRPGKNSSPCNEETRQNLTALKDHEKEIKSETSKSSKLSARIAVLQSRMVGGELTAADKAEAEKIFKDIDALTATIEIRKDAVKTLKSKLRYSHNFDVDEDSHTLQTLSPNETKFKKWLSTLSSAPDPEGTVGAFFQNKKLLEFSVHLTLITEAERFIADRKTAPTKIKLKRNGATDREVGSPTTDWDFARRWPGYVYRDPANVKIVAKSGKDDEELVDQVERLPQRGKLRLLPLQSRWGEHNTLNADFAADGVPTKVTYTTPQASGVAMLGALDDALGGALTVSDLLVAKKEASKTEKEGAAAKALAGLKLEVDTLEQRKKLLELQNGPTQEVADINAELTLLRLQKERAELQASIRNAQPKADD